jgi:hypothetical protein
MFEIESFSGDIDTVLDLYNIIDDESVLNFLKTGIATILDLENMTIGLYQHKNSDKRECFLLRDNPDSEARLQKMNAFFDGLDSGELRLVQ